MFMNPYRFKKYIAIVLVCFFIFSMFTFSTLTDAKRKKRGPTESGEVNTWWDDLTDSMDVKEIIEEILENIGLLQKDRADLEDDKLMQKRLANRADRNAGIWEKAKNNFLTQYQNSYNAYMDAVSAKSTAEYNLTIAKEDIADANERLDAIVYYSQKYPSSSYGGEWEDQMNKKKEAMAKRDAAEAEIPMQQGIIDTENARMSILRKEILRCQGMVNHHKARETFHENEIVEIDKKIAAIDAQIAAEKAAIEKLEKDYETKDDDERAEEGEPQGITHISSDTTIDMGETHKFQVVTDSAYMDVTWVLENQDGTGRPKFLSSNTGDDKANKALMTYRFSEENGITPYTNYILRATVTRHSDMSTYSITFEIRTGP